MEQVLVTGGCGFMGSNFIRALHTRLPGARVTNLDALTYAGNPDNLADIADDSWYRFVKGDIADTELVRTLMAKSEVVVDFAAETHVDRSIHGAAGDFIHTNIEGVHALLEALRDAPNVKKLVHISTDEVWGDLALDETRRFSEDSPFLPNSPYAASKAAGDLLARAYAQTYGLPIIVTHSVNNFGARQYPEKLIPFFVARALKDEPLPLYGDGLYVRDWLYVDDHSEAVMTIIEKGAPGSVYAVSAENERSNLDIARGILAVLGKPENLIAFVPDRPGHDRRYAVDASRLRALGWTPRASFEEKLAETVQWYAEHPAALAAAENRGVNAHISAV